jgi:hypothetical protein
MDEDNSDWDFRRDHNRQIHDKGWTIAYIAHLAVIAGASVYAWRNMYASFLTPAHGSPLLQEAPLEGILFGASLLGSLYSNPEFGKIGDKRFMNNPSNCDIGHPSRGLRAIDTEAFDAGEFVHLAAAWMVASICISVVIGFLYVYTFRFAPKVMVFGSIILFSVVLVWPPSMPCKYSRTS